MIERYLIIVGSLIFLILGTAHLALTFFTNKFMTRNPETTSRMKTDNPVLTKQTTVWNAWIGFNASHSVGMMFIGLINLIVATQHFELYQNSLVLLVVNNITFLFYLFLAKTYWFRIPFIGILLSTTCFLVATILIVVQA